MDNSREVYIKQLEFRMLISSYHTIRKVITCIHHFVFITEVEDLLAILMLLGHSIILSPCFNSPSGCVRTFVPLIDVLCVNPKMQNTLYNNIESQDLINFPSFDILKRTITKLRPRVNKESEASGEKVGSSIENGWYLLCQRTH